MARLGTTYLIRDYQVPTFETRLAKLQKRIAKYGLPAVTAETHPSFEEKVQEPIEDGLGDYVRDDLGRIQYRTVIRTWVPVSLFAPDDVKLDGWRLVAVLQPTEAGTLAAAVPGESVPVEYQDTDRSCDHCQTRRHRKDVVLVGHDDGRYAQVGRNCLRDYLGTDPTRLVAFWEALGAFGADLESGLGGTPDPLDGLSLKPIVAVAATLIRMDGWVSRTVAKEWEKRATADDVLAFLFPPKFEGRDADQRRAEYRAWREIRKPQPQDVEKATAAIAWAAGLENVADYLHNLKVLARLGYTFAKTFGLAVSLVAAYQRQVEQELKRKEFEKKSADAQPWTSGRQTFQVTVERARREDTPYGTDVFKALYRRADGATLWGTIPAALMREVDPGAGIEAVNGLLVTMKGTITPKYGEPTHGWLKRPTLVAIQQQEQEA